MRKLMANAIGGKPVRARQEPDGMRVEREMMGLSGSGTNLNEAVRPTDLKAGSIKLIGIADTLPTEGFHD